LLAREKQLTREQDALAADRRRLPMVLVDKAYRFDGPDGPVGLADMFDGRRQLILQHVMWLAEQDRGCPSCSADIDEISPGLIKHLRARETNYVLVSRGPLDSIQRYRERMGWTLPWYSSLGSDFNYDFGVSMDPAKAPVEYNYRSAEDWAKAGVELVGPGMSGEQPGISCFLRGADGEVYHTYSTYGRGTDRLGGGYNYLDLTALGRQEAWEEPKGRADQPRDAVPDFAE
jgi:predicted dithiol-disulfide oxidoreductase (DUF899 family)